MEVPLFGKVKRPLPWIVGAIALLGAVSGGVYALRAREDYDLDELTVEVRESDVTARIDASGTVVPDKSVNVSPKTSGRIDELLVEQGDRVEAGQPLAVMENDQLEALMLQARANLAEAEARLEEAEAGTRTEAIAAARARYEQARAQLQQARERIPREIEQAQALVTSAESRFELAEDRLERNRSLLAEGAISQDSFDEVLNEYRSAQASLNEARQRLEQARSTNRPEIAALEAAMAEARAALTEAENGPRAENIAQLRAAVEAARAQVRAAEVDYGDATVRAPFAGIVTQRYATEGAFVTPTTSASSTASATSTSILAIATGLEVLAEVPEVDVGQLRPGQPVEVVADAYPDRVFEGTIERIAPEAVVEQNVTSFEVRVQLATGLDVLQSGMNVDVTFVGEEIADATVVPTVAIVTREGETGVLAVDEDDRPEFQPVTIGSTFDSRTQILEGVAPGTRVFTDVPEQWREEDE